MDSKRCVAVAGWVLPYIVFYTITRLLNKKLKVGVKVGSVIPTKTEIVIEV